MGPLPSSALLNDIVLDSTRKLPLHAQLKSSLERLIQENFDDTSRFFSESQLTGQLQVSQGTVRRALTELAADGILEKRPARGTIVRKKSAGRRLDHLAVFLPQYISANIVGLLSVLSGEALRRQIQLQPIFTHKGESLHRAYKQLQFRPEEGAAVLLANPPMATAELAEALHDKGYDCVSVDTQLADTRQRFVGVDNRAGIVLGLDHLVALGHRSIALLVSEPAATRNINERITAFQDYQRSNGLQLDARVYVAGTRNWESSSAAALAEMGKIWDAQPRPTAIFAASDSGAISAIQWLLKRKIRVPEDVSVLGFDGSDFGARIHPMLTSVSNSFDAFSESVFALLDKKADAPTRIFIPPTLVIRESTGQVPNASQMNPASPNRPKDLAPCNISAGDCAGFTLFELMIVLVIIGIIAAIVSPLVPALLRANQLDSSVNTLSGILEEARETAISGNTFVWVGFTDPPANSPVTGTWVGTFQSQDGTELISSGSTLTPLTDTSALIIPSGNLLIHSKLQNLSGVKIDYLNTTISASIYNSKTPTPTTLAPTGFTQLQSNLLWSLTTLASTGMGAGNYSDVKYFVHGLEYTPDGQAHVSTWNTNIQFGLVPTVGNTTNSVLFNISRLTGKATVYRM